MAWIRVLQDRPQWHPKILRIGRSLPHSPSGTHPLRQEILHPLFESEFPYNASYIEENDKETLISGLASEEPVKVYFNNSRRPGYLPVNFPLSEKFKLISRMMKLIHSNVPTWTLEPKSPFNSFLYHCLRADLRNCVEDHSLLRKVQGLITHVHTVVGKHIEYDFDTDQEKVVDHHGIVYLTDFVYKRYYCAAEALLPDEFYKIVGYIYTLVKQTDYETEFLELAPPPYSPSVTQSPTSEKKTGDLVFGENSIPPPQYVAARFNCKVYTRR